MLPEPTLFTIGHGSRSWEEFLAALRDAGVRCLVDVRRVPRSRRHPHVCRERMEGTLSAEGVGYLWEGDRLGGWRKPRHDSPHSAIQDESFRGYADHMESVAFSRGLERLLALAADAPTAVMCAERLPWRCHRFFLADAALLAGARVVHLLGLGQQQEHRLNPAARIEGRRLVYDHQGPGQLELDL